MKKILISFWLLLLITSVSCSKTLIEGTASPMYVLALRQAGEMGIVFALDIEKEAVLTPLSNLDSWLPIWSILWSPDGKSLAFVTNRDGNREIYTMDLETTTTLNLSRNPAADVAPTWSPDSQSIAFISTRDHCPIDEITPDQDCVIWSSELYTIERNGNHIKRITDTTRTSKGEVRWIPGHNRLVYTASENGGWLYGGTTDIYCVDLDTGRITQLTDSSAVTSELSYMYNIAPLPSPNGEYILFQSYRDNDNELYLMRTDGSDQTRLTTMPGSEFDMQWSPDSKYIAWSHDYQEIFVLHIETMTLITTDTRALSACNPKWTPSGDRIAFVANCGFGGSGPHDTVYMMNRDGSSKVKLISEAGGKRISLLGWVPYQWIAAGNFN